MSGILTSMALIGGPSGRREVPRRKGAGGWTTRGDASYGPRRGLRRIERVFRDRLRDDRRVERTFVGERLECRDRHVPAVDLEEAAQLLARVGAAEPVGAEHDVAPGHVRANLLG